MANFANLLLENQGFLELESKKGVLQLESLLTTGDLVDHIFQFSDFGSALNDPVVGPTFNSPLLVGFPNKEILVYSNTAINSVNAEPGFWVIVTALGQVGAFQLHSQIRIINDLTLMCAGQPSALFFTLNPAFTNIVVSNYGLYCSGLTAPVTTPANGLIAEDGITFLIAEDGATFLVQE